MSVSELSDTRMYMAVQRLLRGSHQQATSTWAGGGDYQVLEAQIAVLEAKVELELNYCQWMVSILGSGNEVDASDPVPPGPSAKKRQQPI